ncbi:Glycerol-3-phosphate dehydrogenase [NAD(+)], cytoplasmic [Echinococcus granulosus]|uniref:Glycerol-3-phosphate dehydrogenase [NAD(+)] n=1 Tax=Echinococcus granulosus TaxID=6210 RepID=A0A068WSV5_ECHGR|nr:Glycerol-3-phosphate dehydrogenase [NAD(+)], cytoplasmic [Echinococcus granulosus]CDS22873.1 glycerol 3 phosphate dehydrogenase NAD [Echinococcus granulosus]
MAIKKCVSIVGSGNWGSTIAKIVGRNVLQMESFEDQVRMWVFEEIINGQKLTELINKEHENVKYLPGVRLPPNVVALPDLESCCQGADVLIFVLPHQFLKNVCQALKPHLKPGCYGCSLIKGLNRVPGVGVSLLTDLIRETLNIPCAVMMGANLASEVAQEKFCESTVGSLDRSRGLELKELFETPYFRISVISDEIGAELCGALKNIVAIGAGLGEGLGYGENTKAAIIRLGFMEMKRFIFQFFSKRGPQESTFLESCGVADLITTCYGGRNRKIGFALATTDKSVVDLEAELLGGQSAQGVLTAAEVFAMLHDRGLEAEFPIFTMVHRICQRQEKANVFIECLRRHPAHMCFYRSLGNNW